MVTAVKRVQDECVPAELRRLPTSSKLNCTSSETQGRENTALSPLDCHYNRAAAAEEDEEEEASPPGPLDLSPTHTHNWNQRGQLVLQNIVDEN
ncbi:hypothetical protein JOB18_009292 [Solea senegalensis]|uniref:Uncharacterized protein n=1 Tax=Solea senegalensis TaxID=28829 RepID=A0AAV6PSD8_SOLSE|nr:hypothetical protein JOB18_009292 [Solea senegalensis]